VRKLWEAEHRKAESRRDDTPNCRVSAPTQLRLFNNHADV